MLTFTFDQKEFPPLNKNPEFWSPFVPLSRLQSSTSQNEVDGSPKSQKTYRNNTFSKSSSNCNSKNNKSKGQSGLKFTFDQESYPPLHKNPGFWSPFVSLKHLQSSTFQNDKLQDIKKEEIEDTFLAKVKL